MEIKGSQWSYTWQWISTLKEYRLLYKTWGWPLPSTVHAWFPQGKTTRHWMWTVKGITCLAWSCNALYFSSNQKLPFCESRSGLWLQWQTVTMGVSTPGRNIALAFENCISTCFGLVMAMAGSNQFSPVQCTWQIDSIRDSVAYCVTSDLDFNKRHCVIEWTKALC